MKLRLAVVRRVTDLVRFESACNCKCRTSHTRMQALNLSYAQEFLEISATLYSFRYQKPRCFGVEDVLRSVLGRLSIG